ncbi:hypothetical protein QUW07_03385 [[Clostridium] symbiosum]|jgi:hypothetical protein|nr:hypothetical protein [[Clostridium] symbiosum]
MEPTFRLGLTGNPRSAPFSFSLSFKFVQFSCKFGRELYRDLPSATLSLFERSYHWLGFHEKGDKLHLLAYEAVKEKRNLSIS